MPSYGGIFRLPPQPQQRRATVPVEAHSPPPRPRVPSGLAIIQSHWAASLDQPPQQRQPQVAALIQPQVFTRLPGAILRSWEPPEAPPTPSVKLPPLVLTFGDQPTPFTRRTLDRIIAAWAFFQTLPPRGRGGIIWQLPLLTWTIRAGATPIVGVKVWLSSADIYTAQNIVPGSILHTDALGTVSYSLQADVTYYGWRDHPRYTWTDPWQFRFSSANNRWEYFNGTAYVEWTP